MIKVRFYVLPADIEERTTLIAHLGAAGILALFHYVPLHSSPFAQSLGVPQTHLPRTENLARDWSAAGMFAPS